MPGPRHLTALLVFAALFGACGTVPQPTPGATSGNAAVAGPSRPAGQALPTRSESPTTSPAPTTQPTSGVAPTPTPEPLIPIPEENYTTLPLLAISADGPCAIKTDRTLICWGMSDGFVPSGTFKAVATDEWGACGLRTDGRVVCWSSELSGGPKGRFKALSPNGGCGIRADDMLACWGTDGDGHKAKLPGGRFVALSDWCAIRADGSVACWGGTEEAPPEGSGPFTQINGPCGVRTDGSLLCWSTYPEVNAAAPAGTFTFVEANQVGGCAIRTSGELACWGTALQVPTDQDAVEARYYAPPDGRFTSVSLGEIGYVSCALREDGIAVCWGEGAGAPTPGLAIRVLAKPPYRDFPDFLVTGRRIPVAWKATPVTAPIKSVALGYTWRRWDGVGSWNDETESEEPVTWQTGPGSGTATFKGKRGYTYCFTAEATDTEGVKGDGYGGCASIPLDERDLEASAGWTKVAGSAFYEGTALRATRKGQTLTLDGTSSLALGVIATTCPTCGTIEVSWEGIMPDDEDPGGSTEEVGSQRVSLRSPRTMHRALVFLTDNGQMGVSGMVTIKVTSKGKPVIIDAIVLAPYET